MPGHYTAMKSDLCSRCHRAPRRTTHCWCVECLRAYNREWCRRHRGTRPRPIKPVLQEGEKFCRTCERILPEAHFSRSASKRDGRMSNCKDCDYLKKLRYRRKNKAKIREQQRLSSRKWRADHPDYNRKSLAKSKRKRIAEKMRQAAGARI